MPEYQNIILLLTNGTIDITKNIRSVKIFFLPLFNGTKLKLIGITMLINRPTTKKIPSRSWC